MLDKLLNTIFYIMIISYSIVSIYLGYYVNHLALGVLIALFGIFIVFYAGSDM